jgi:hypothetical protein
MQVLEHRNNGAVRLDAQGLSRSVAAQILAAAIVENARQKQGKQTDPTKLKQAIKRFRVLTKNKMEAIPYRDPHRVRKIIELPRGLLITEDPDCKTCIIIPAFCGRKMLSEADLANARKILERLRASGKSYVIPRNPRNILPRTPNLNQVV